MNPLRFLLPLGLVLCALPLRATVDRNSDGISDIWSARYPTAGVPTADPDGDGANNLAEALAGTDPLANASRIAGTLQPDASGNLVLHWPSVSGKHYRIESTSNLQVWSPVSGEFEGTGSQLSTIVRAAGSPAPQPEFWRVAVFDADADSDGLSDWEELQIGTNPNDADSDDDGRPDAWDAPTIATQPQNRTVAVGQTATFLVEAIASPAPTFQWRKGGNPIAGATSANYTTPITTQADNGSRFSVVVTNSAGTATSAEAVLTVNPTTVRVLYLHHSTGGNLWAGGVPQGVASYNASHGTSYQITEYAYPNSPYPWANYPYDYWNLWVNPNGPSNTTQPGVYNLETIVANFDVIVFKHCYPVSSIGPNTGNPNVASSVQTVENYQAQYNALKAKLHSFPTKRFIVWTGAALTEATSTPAIGQRSRDFFTWVKTNWDESGDNIFVWDFFELETEGGNFLKLAYAASAGDPHPNAAFCQTVAPHFVRRLINVIEGRGDTTRLDGKP